uniref:Uncharacterized protein n=1 Tax=Anguilla anguilla TaxID=7936 RepID=A0A0E9S3A0_ANGAN
MVGAVFPSHQDNLDRSDYT